MASAHYPPTFAKGQYHCPHCGVFSKQYWSHLIAKGDLYSGLTGGAYRKSNISGLAETKETLPQGYIISKCEHCRGYCIWIAESMIYPRSILVEQPNSDLDVDIQKDYLEAANIFNDSPRAAAALLRLGLQKLCKQLGEKGENINDDIGELVKKGLNISVQRALDSLRIIGNNGVHPGEINLTEEPEKVLKLFEIMNFIANKMITEPKELESLYDSLPAEKKDAVTKRDSKNSTVEKATENIPNTST